MSKLISIAILSKCATSAAAHSLAQICQDPGNIGNVYSISNPASDSPTKQVGRLLGWSEFSKFQGVRSCLFETMSGVQDHVGFGSSVTLELVALAEPAWAAERVRREQMHVAYLASVEAGSLLKLTRFDGSTAVVTGTRARVIEGELGNHVPVICPLEFAAQKYADLNYATEVFSLEPTTQAAPPTGPAARPTLVGVQYTPGVEMTDYASLIRLRGLKNTLFVYNDHAGAYANKSYVKETKRSNAVVRPLRADASGWTPRPNSVASLGIPTSTDVALTATDVASFGTLVNQVHTALDTIQTYVREHPETNAVVWSADSHWDLQLAGVISNGWLAAEQVMFIQDLVKLRMHRIFGKTMRTFPGRPDIRYYAMGRSETMVDHNRLSPEKFAALLGNGE